MRRKASKPTIISALFALSLLSACSESSDVNAPDMVMPTPFQGRWSGMLFQDSTNCSDGSIGLSMDVPVTLETTQSGSTVSIRTDCGTINASVDRDGRARETAPLTCPTEIKNGAQATATYHDGVFELIGNAQLHVFLAVDTVATMGGRTVTCKTTLQDSLRRQ